MELVLMLPNQAQGIYGVLHVPDDLSLRPRIGVVMVHAEGASKTGHKRWFVELARRLERVGVASLRFDLLGEGESEELEEDPYRCWRGLQPMVLYLLESLELDRLLLAGDCFGGLLAAHYALLDPRVERVFLWNLGQVRWTPEQLARFRGIASPALESARTYWAKLLTPETWRKMASLRLQPGPLWRQAVSAPVSAIAAGALRRVGVLARGVSLEHHHPEPRGRIVPLTVFHASHSPAHERTLAIARHVLGNLGGRAEHVEVAAIEFSAAWKEAVWDVIARTCVPGGER